MENLAENWKLITGDDGLIKNGWFHKMWSNFAKNIDKVIQKNMKNQ